MAAWLQRLAGNAGSKVFGAPLDEAIKRSPNGIPLVLVKCIEYLDNEEVLKQEGLFRKSGNHMQIQDMKQRMDKGEDIDLSKIQDPHTVCGLMKQYLRELPEPLCTFELYDCFIAAIGIPDETMRKQQLANVLDMLPESNQVLTKYLISFLCRVSTYAADNLMTPANLATVFAPNLIRPPGDDLGALVEYTPHSNRTMEILILHYDELLAKFPDPSPVNNAVAADIHQKSGWNHLKLLPQGWKPNSSSAAAPPAVGAEVAAPLPTGPPPPLPPYPSSSSSPASYDTTSGPALQQSTLAPLPTGPPPPLPPHPQTGSTLSSSSSSSSSLSSSSSSSSSSSPSSYSSSPAPSAFPSSVPSQGFKPRAFPVSYYGQSPVATSGSYPTPMRPVPAPPGGVGRGSSGSGSDILVPRRPPPPLPSSALGAAPGRGPLSGSDPGQHAPVAPASPNQGRPLPSVGGGPGGGGGGGGETKKPTWPPVFNGSRDDNANTYPSPSAAPLVLADDASIPRRGARVIKKASPLAGGAEDMPQAQASASVTAMLIKSKKDSGGSSSPAPAPATATGPSASKLIKPFVPPGASASVRGPSPAAAAATKQQGRNPAFTVTGGTAPFASTTTASTSSGGPAASNSPAFSRPQASPTLSSSGSRPSPFGQPAAPGASGGGGPVVGVSPSIQERMRTFGS